MASVLRNRCRFGVVLFGAALVACGGGGGGGGGGAGPSGNTSTPVAITSANAQQVASDAFAATSFAISSADVANPAMLTANKTPVFFSLRRFADGYLQRLRDRSTGEWVNVQMVYEDVYDCIDGGSYSLVWDDADDDLTDSAGDSYSTVYSNCIEAGVTTNGAVSATLASFSGDLFGDYTMNATFAFDGLTLTYAGFTVSIDGTMGYSASLTGAISDATISIPSLTLSEPSGSVTISSATLQYSYNNNTAAYSYSVGATLNSTAIGGQVTLSTIAPLSGTGFGYPVSGSMRATGASNSSVTLTATGGGNVRLDVDSDGDGVIDSSSNTTWAALLAA